ncbi:MAG: hypothetical protein APF81_06195 [Desulfosporosinus sp. BRH_c37]|nr:MAG: hypothetical protein APF81_06195 [Desulfosporosinus sp. BRH_c37]
MRDLCHTALGTYDAEQTNRSSAFFGERGPRHKRRPARRLIRAKTVSSGAMAAVNILVHCSVSGVGRLNGSLLACLRKDVAPV